MIRQVFQPGLHAPVIFAGDEYEAIGLANLAGQAFERLGSFSQRIFLVHPVEHRKVDRLGIDQFDVIAAAPKSLDHEFRKADAHPVGTIGAVKNEDSIAHGCPSAVPLRPKPIISRHERGVADTIQDGMSGIVSLNTRGKEAEMDDRTVRLALERHWDASDANDFN